MTATELSALHWLIERLAWERTLNRLRARAQLAREAGALVPDPADRSALDIPEREFARMN